jgi:phage-related protein
MALTDYVQGLDIENPIDLFSVSNSSVLNFPTTNFCNVGNISYRGVQYLAIACKIQWIPKDSDRAIVTRLSVSDASNTVGTLINNYGVLGARLTVYRTWSPFLDNQPGADPLAYRTFEMRINQYSGSFGREFEFDLVPAESLEQKGGRRYLRRCLWQLGDDNCQAPSNLNYDLSGNATSPANRACRKDLTQCKQYHGNIKRFGGFPGVQYRR